MYDESSDVSDDLEYTSSYHARHESPRPHLDALEGMDNQR